MDLEYKQSSILNQNSLLDDKVNYLEGKLNQTYSNLNDHKQNVAD